MNTPSTKDPRSDRDNLGPTGPAKMPADSKADPDKKHPHPGNVTDADKPQVGPTPTDDPRGKASQLENEIDKKRAQTPPD
jgi:hypothetical protein